MWRGGVSMILDCSFEEWNGMMGYLLLVYRLG
jgi:hypothetical protein